MDELDEYPVCMVCRVLNIPRSSYYDMRENGSRRKKYEESLIEAVQATFFEHHGSFGRRVMKILLEQKGIFISERKISSIMKQLGLRSKYGRKRCKNVYTSKNTEDYIRKNIFAQLSNEERKDKEIWSMDFTEQKVENKKIFTCGIVSVNKKVLVGYSQSNRCTAALAVEAVTQAVKEHGVPDMIMTDRGSQFTSKSFFDTMTKLKITHSMSRPGRPGDNCYIETFWKTMKVEIGKLDLLNDLTYRMVVGYYIHYYNNLRPHSALNYRAPLAA